MSLGHVRQLDFGSVQANDPFACYISHRLLDICYTFRTISSTGFVWLDEFESSGKTSSIGLVLFLGQRDGQWMGNGFACLTLYCRAESCRVHGVVFLERCRRERFELFVAGRIRTNPRFSICNAIVIQHIRVHGVLLALNSAVSSATLPDNVRPTYVLTGILQVSRINHVYLRYFQ